MLSSEFTEISSEIISHLNKSECPAREIGEMASLWNSTQAIEGLSDMVDSGNSSVLVQNTEKFRNSLNSAKKKLLDISTANLFARLTHLEIELTQIGNRFDLSDTILTEVVSLLHAVSENYESFLKRQTNGNTVKLLDSAAQADAAISASRGVFSISQYALVRSANPQSNESQFELVIHGEMNIAAITITLHAVEHIYQEICALLPESETKPLRIAKIETGSLFMSLVGSGAAIALLNWMVKAAIRYYHRNFTDEGVIQAIPKQVEAAEAILGLSLKLQERGIDVTPIEDKLRKATVVIADKLNRSLSSQADITVDSERISLDEVLQQKLLEQTYPRALPSREMMQNTEDDPDTKASE